MADDRIAPPPMVPTLMARTAAFLKDGWDAAQSRIAELEAELAAAREQIAALTESCLRETEARAQLQAEHARMVEGAKGVRSAKLPKVSWR